MNVLKLNSEWNMCYCTSFIMSKEQHNKTLSNVVSLTEGWTEPSTCLEHLTDSSDVIKKWPVKWSSSSPQWSSSRLQGLLRWSPSDSWIVTKWFSNSSHDVLSWLAFMVGLRRPHARSPPSCWQPLPVSIVINLHWVFWSFPSFVLDGWKLCFSKNNILFYIQDGR